MYISLQKRKKYRARAVSGFKSIARGQINLDQILQCPPNCPIKVNLYQNEKDSKESAKQIEIGNILVSEIMTIPTEDSKYDSSDTEDDGKEYLIRIEILRLKLVFKNMKAEKLQQKVVRWRQE